MDTILLFLGQILMGIVLLIGIIVAVIILIWTVAGLAALIGDVVIPTLYREDRIKKSGSHIDSLPKYPSRKDKQ